MIQGFFLRRRPYVDAVFRFPSLNNQRLRTRLLIDTGSDRVTFTPSHARLRELAQAYGVDFYALPQGPAGYGPSGASPTRTIEAVLTLGIFPNSAVIGSVEVRIVEPPSDREVRELPPLLGRDILSRFALFLEERTNRVFLLEPHEADALDFPQ